MKKKTPLKVLLIIPIQLVISVLLVLAGIALDSGFWKNVESGATGHPFPVFTILLFFIAVFAFVMAFLIAVVISIVTALKNSKDNGNEAQQSGNNIY